MKRGQLLIIGIFLSLSACGRGQTVVEHMTIRTTDATRVLSLITSTEHVLTRRLAAVNVKNASVAAVPTGAKSATLTLKLADIPSAEKAKAILAEPFRFDLRIEEPTMKKVPDDTALTWIPTALTGSNLEWVQVIGNSRTGEVAIELQFTKQGKKILSSVFRGNVGKHLGIFVRDLLVSKLIIEKAPITDRVLISGIPSAKVAEIFADDVNVGLSVLFTPAP